MLIKFTSDVALGSGLGFLIGVFAPSVGRKIKALFVKETKALKTAVVTSAKAEVTKIESKL